jgi:hypothetical protein
LSLRVHQYEKVFTALARKYNTAFKVQQLIKKLKYNQQSTMMSALDVHYQRTAHCMEGAFYAAAILEYLGHPPLTISFESQDGLDHVIYLFKQNNFWGSIGQSRDQGLMGRKPVFRSVRDLAWSYFDPYVDATGRILAYQVIDLNETNSHWKHSPLNVWKAENYFLKKKHIRMISSDKRYQKLFRRYQKVGPVPQSKNWW